MPDQFLRRSTPVPRSGVRQAGDEDEGELNTTQRPADMWESAGYITDSRASSLPSPELTPPLREEHDRRMTASNMSPSVASEEQLSGSVSEWDSDDLPEPLHGESRPNRTPHIQAPSVVIGAPLGKELSAIEAADALVEKWELIYDETIRNHGPSAIVGIARQLERVRANRAELDFVEDRASVEDTFEKTAVFKTQAVAERVEHLREVLQDIKNVPTADNIRGAIRSYEDGSLGVSDKYAIFWAGHFMELASSYEEFTEDRGRRMKRYAAQHGRGTLWYEPPLAPGDNASASSAQALAMRGTTSARGFHDHQFVTMSFQGVEYTCDSDSEDKPRKPAKVHGKKLRGAAPKPRKRKRRSSSSSEEETFRSGLVPDPLKPRLCFFMLLDTGATHPCLYQKDIGLLGIDPDDYPAVTTVSTQTANGMVRCIMLELHVTMCDTRKGTSLVDPADPVWPSRPPELGGISPVLVFPNDDKAPEGIIAGLEQNGEVSKTMYNDWKKILHTPTSRLSGLFPLQCCYVQATPPGEKVWFGEDRRDVLGTRRMPGQRRFEHGKSSAAFNTNHPDLKGVLGRYGLGGNPTSLMMEHLIRNTDGEVLMTLCDVETEGVRGRSEIHVRDSSGATDMVTIEPRKGEHSNTGQDSPAADKRAKCTKPVGRKVPAE